MWSPVDTRRRFNVYKTSIRRRIDVLKTLKRRRVSTGIEHEFFAIYQFESAVIIDWFESDKIIEEADKFQVTVLD